MFREILVFEVHSDVLPTFKFGCLEGCLVGVSRSSSLTLCQPFSCISASAIALFAHFLFLFALDLFSFLFALYLFSFPTAFCPFPFISLLPSRLHVFFVARWFWIMGLVSRFIATICL
jgi:hypothetical protein